MCLKWHKWALKKFDKNLGHLPYFKKIIIPPSFQSFTTIAEWENGHFSIISFILRSVGIRMTIEWLTSHFTLTLNDRDDPGMRLIKIFSMENVFPSMVIHVTPCIIGRQGELLHALISISIYSHSSIIGRQGELLHALISISIYSHS